MELENLKSYFKNVISQNCKGLVKGERENQKFLFLVLCIGILGMLIGLISYVKNLNLDVWITKILIGSLIILIVSLIFLMIMRITNGMM